MIFGLHVKRLAVGFPVSKCRKAIYWEYICRNIQDGKQCVCGVKVVHEHFRSY
jgi:hypothetical protein